MLLQITYPFTHYRLLVYAFMSCFGNVIRLGEGGSHNVYILRRDGGTFQGGFAVLVGGFGAALLRALAAPFLQHRWAAFTCANISN